MIVNSCSLGLEAAHKGAYLFRCRGLGNTLHLNRIYTYKLVSNIISEYIFSLGGKPKPKVAVPWSCHLRGEHVRLPINLRLQN